MKALKITAEKLDIHVWEKFIKSDELNFLMQKYNLKNIETKGLVLAGIKKANLNLVSGKIRNWLILATHKKNIFGDCESR